MCTVLLCSHTKTSPTLFHINMHFQISFCLFSLLVTISNIDAWTMKGKESIKNVFYRNDYKGYDMTDDYQCEPACKKAFCELATTGNSPLFQAADIVQGDLKREALEIERSLNILAIKCTDKYQGNKQLYISVGTVQHSVAVYEKPTDGTGVLVGIMTDTPPELEIIKELPNDDQDYEDDEDYYYGG